jgi:opacity protein-like surface antigen
MKHLTLAFAAAGCLAFAIPSAFATSAMPNTHPSGAAATHGQVLAQSQYNSTKKKDNSNTQDQTKRKGWGGGG